MNVERGVVVSADGSRVSIETECTSGCSSCSSSDSCGMLQNSKKRVITMENIIGVSEGDQVEWGMYESGLLASSVLVYLFPVLMLMSGVFAGPLLLSFEEEAASLAGGAAGLLLSFLIIAIVSRVVRRITIFQPHLLRKID